MMDSYLDKRYYSIVVMGPKVPWSFSELWKAIEGIGTGRAQRIGERNCVVEHRTVTVAHYPGRGEPPPEVIRKDGRYVLDLFAVRVKIKADTYLGLGVPFVDLGRRLCLELREAGLLKDVDFVCLNLEDLVKVVRDEDEKVARLNIIKITARSDGNPDLSRFSITGTGAIYTDLYLDLWQALGERRTINRCLARFQDGRGSISINCDQLGNYRMWLQSRAENVKYFGGALETLISSGASFTSAAIPYFRANQGDGDQVEG